MEEKPRKGRKTKEKPSEEEVEVEKLEKLRISIRNSNVTHFWSSIKESMKNTIPKKKPFFKMTKVFDFDGMVEKTRRYYVLTKKSQEWWSQKNT